MTCDTVRELTSGLIDGELDPNTATEVHDHLDDCSACAEYFTSLTGLAEIFAAATPDTAATVPADLWDRIAAEAAVTTAPALARTTRSARPARPARQIIPSARQWAVAAAALIAVALPAYLVVFQAAPAAPADGSSCVYTAPAGLELATFVREIQSGSDEPREFLALHDSREVSLAELPEHVEFEPRFPSCIPSGLTMDKCYLLRTADGTAIGCEYRSGTRRMMVFQQRAGEPVQYDGLTATPVDRCGVRCRTLVSGNVTVLNWEGEGRATTVVCREVDAAEIDGLLNSMIDEQ